MKRKKRFENYKDRKVDKTFFIMFIILYFIYTDIKNKILKVWNCFTIQSTVFFWVSPIDRTPTEKIRVPASESSESDQLWFYSAIALAAGQQSINFNWLPEKNGLGIPSNLACFYKTPQAISSLMSKRNHVQVHL